MAPRKQAREFKMGDKVTAKWPGTNAFYPGIVTKVRRDHQYEIKFGDDSYHTIHPRNVYAPDSPTHSPERGQPPKSPKSKSPGRKPRARKTSRSPARTRKSSKSRSSSRSRMETRSSTTSITKEAKNISPKSNSTPSTSTPKTLTRSAIKTIKPAQTFSEFTKKDKLYRMGFRPKEFQPNEEDEEEIDTPNLEVKLTNRILVNTGFIIGTICLPFFVFWINLTCDRTDCTLGGNKFPARFHEYFDLETTAIFIGWILFQLLLANLPIGQQAEGQPLIDAYRLRYRLNGLHSCAITMAIVMGFAYLRVSFDFVLDKLLQLITAATLTTLAVSVVLFVQSRKLPQREITPGLSDSYGSWFFLGRQLNPRIGEFDFKFFCLLRPGLIGWAVFNILMLVQEYQSNENFYPSIWFVGLGQLWYILDAFFFEEAVLSGWDINKEGCGFLMVFRSFCFTPFIFSLPMRFLVLYRPHVEGVILTLIVGLHIAGYSIYRMANKQKDDFRRNPYHAKFSTARTIETKTTRKIFVDGWWRQLRHPNYSGDLLIALSWCLPCGIEYFVPYVYFFYLLILLTYRAYQDDKACYQKYGDAWNTYTKSVRYRIIPYCY